MNKQIAWRSALALLILASGLQAVKARQIEKRTFFDFQKGTFENICVDDRGRLFLGPQIKKLAGPDEEFFFSMAASKNGDIYLGSGHQASIWRLIDAGKPEKIFSADQLDVFAMLVSNRGDLVAATSPSGKVYRIGKDNKAKEIFNPDEKFIWDVKEDKQGNIIVAVGNTGGIYSISPAGEVQNLFTADDNHIVTLEIGRDGSILAGSGDRGILYQISQTKVRVLFDSPLDEIKSIAEDKEGNIYFAAVKKAASKTIKDAEISSLFQKKEVEEKPQPKEKSILYRLQTDGTVEELWSSDEEYIYSLYYSPALQSVLVGTGNSGRIYRVNKDGSYSQYMELESAQVFKLLGTVDGFIVVTNNTAQIMRVENHLAANGVYFSEIFDATTQSRFGRVTWTADRPTQTGVSFFVRSGNSDDPDSSWTSWSAPFNDPDNSNANVSGARYLQVKVTLNSAKPDQTPQLAGYRIYFVESNLKPVIKGLSITKPKENGEKINATAAETKVKQPKKSLWVSYEVDDANQDKLAYALYLKKITGGEWIEIKKNHLDKSLYLDMEIYEDGRYQLKLEADDSPDNPPAQAKTSTYVSQPFTIDSTPPELSDWQISGNIVRFMAKDATSIVSQAFFSMDGKDWYPIFSEDGINDAGVERFNFNLPVSHSTKTLFVKLLDELDNQRVYQKEL